MINEANVEIPVKDGLMPGCRAMPEGEGPFPVVIVVQEIFGIHEYIRNVCRRLAREGYLAVAPSLYFREGDATKIQSIDELREKIVNRVSVPRVLTDLDATAEWAGKSGGDLSRLGITGFCWGGIMTWLHAARPSGLKAAVAWYGRLTGVKSELFPAYPLDVAGRLKAPVLGLYGGRDPSIPTDQVERMRSLLKEANAPSEIVVYPDAGHGFHADYRPSYDERAAKDGWKRMLEWLRAHGVG